MLVGDGKKVTRYNVEGQATKLPDLKKGRAYHTCGKFTNKKGETVIQGSKRMHLSLKLLMQFYIATGGYFTDSTEILKTDGGSSWQAAANLPSARATPKGISLSNGRFMLTG